MTGWSARWLILAAVPVLLAAGSAQAGGRMVDGGKSAPVLQAVAQVPVTEAEPIFLVVPPDDPDGTKFSLPVSRLHKARVRIEGPSFVTGYVVSTARGAARVAPTDIVAGQVVLMVDEGAVNVEGIGWGRKVCEGRGQARVGVELTLGCGAGRS
jgi:hypothetical protein